MLLERTIIVDIILVYAYKRSVHILREVKTFFINHKFHIFGKYNNCSKFEKNYYTYYFASVFLFNLPFVFLHFEKMFYYTIFCCLL